MKMPYEKIYKIARILIYLIPAISITVGSYLILFPIERFGYDSSQPNISKFDIRKDLGKKELFFGAFPLRKHRFVNLKINLKNISDSSCRNEIPAVSLEKTHQAFLYPEGAPIEDSEELRSLLYEENRTRYPNGTLIHLKPTDEVFVISNGKRILFPGPEIFFAFGYSFEDLVDVDQSALDRYPEAETRVFLWTQPHPDGTIFQGFPSRSIYLVLNGQKRLIANEDILKEVWPEYHTIPIDDLSFDNRLACQISKEDYAQGTLDCTFDTNEFPPLIGKYYLFTIKYSSSCDAAEVHFDTARISFIAEKSYATIKDTVRTIFTSILNRYLGQ